MIRTYRVKLEGLGPIQFSRPVEEKIKPKATQKEWAEFEARVWRDKAHINEDS